MTVRTFKNRSKFFPVQAIWKKKERFSRFVHSRWKSLYARPRPVYRIIRRLTFGRLTTADCRTQSPRESIVDCRLSRITFWKLRGRRPTWMQFVFELVTTRSVLRLNFVWLATDEIRDLAILSDKVRNQNMRNGATDQKCYRRVPANAHICARGVPCYYLRHRRPIVLCWLYARVRCAT